MKSIIRILDQKILSTFILLITDILWYSIAFLTAFFLRNAYGQIQPFSVYATAVPLGLLILIGIFYHFGLYAQRRRITPLNEIYLVIKAITFWWILIMAASYLQKYDYSRIFVVTFWFLSLISLNFGRFTLRLIQRNLYKKGVGLTNVLIIGAGKPGRNLARKIKDYEQFGYQVKGFLDDHSKPVKNGFKFLGSTKNILSEIKKRNIHLVFIADPSISHENILNLIHRCEKTKVKFKVVSDLFEIITGDLDLNEIETLPSINLNNDKDNIFYHFTKRLIDIILSLVAIILVGPFLLLFALLIRLSSPGNAFFTQERVGHKGKKFKLYKLRTMYQNSKKHEYSPKEKNDPRITPIGKFLRRFSLDEFPQVWNVLKGEMSIVGPRPEMTFIVSKYSDWQKKRLDVKPGLTGLWQILGRKDLPLHENIEYDFYYIKNRSLLLDLIIILKTFIVLISRKGAY